jgi:hypothetical protein
VLDPIERACEVLFGVIMVLTFTGSISVAEGDAKESRTVQVAAIGCNFAWGIVDAAMYLVANFANRARSLATLHARSRERDARTQSFSTRCRRSWRPYSRRWRSKQCVSG